IVSVSKAMQNVFSLINKVAPTSSTVLIFGESGTGKELVARAIHYNSPRRDGPFVVVDCTSLPKDLMESELFGHKKGAFTGAIEDKKGLIEEANGGTLFLDEIGELPLELQGKLLRVLQTRELRPVGDQKTRQVDVRFIAATNRDLEEMVREGRFREDLYWRLNIFPVKVPPLRQRKEDIPVLVQHFIDKYSEDIGGGPYKLTTEAMKVLMAHNWPGNVRELENTIHRAMLLSSNGLITEKEIHLAGIDGQRKIPKTLEELKEAKRALKKLAEEELERAFVMQALEEAGWNVTRAAENVGMQRTNFHALMRKYGIKRKR
ncbi:MAG: sigma-54-dependent Fis family transcriptional regulator, partial [Nitrospirae bacterium]